MVTNKSNGSSEGLCSEPDIQASKIHFAMNAARNWISLSLLAPLALSACNAQTPRQHTTSADASHVWKLQRVDKSTQAPDIASPGHELKPVRLFSLLLPEGWNVVSKDGPGPPDCANQMGRLNIIATSADKSTGIIIVPTQATYWSTNPMANRQRASMSQTWRFNCTVTQPKTLAAGLTESVEKAGQDNHAVGSVQPVPGLSSELPRIVEQANQSLAGSGQHIAAEAGRIRVEGTLNGKPSEMWVVAMQTSRSSNGPGGSETITDIPLFAIAFAPQGQLDANDKLLMTVLSSVQIDPQWTTYNQQLISNILQTISNTNATVARIHQQMLQDNANAAAQQAQIRSNAANTPVRFAPMLRKTGLLRSITPPSSSRSTWATRPSITIPPVARTSSSPAPTTTSGPRAPATTTATSLRTHQVTTPTVRPAVAAGPRCRWCASPVTGSHAKPALAAHPST